MIAFGHTAIGTLVGVYSYGLTQGSADNLSLAIPLGAGIVSHYVTDFIPHGHFMGDAFKNFSKTLVGILIFDLAFSVVLFAGISYMLFGVNTLLFYILAGVAGSQLPDVIDGLMGIKVLPKKGFLKKENNFHQLVHWHGSYEKALIIGFLDIWQLAVVIFTLWVLFTI